MDSKILIGKIVTSVGIKGEVKIYNYSDEDRFLSLKHIYLGDKKYEIVKARKDGNTSVVKLSGINDRNTADTLRNKEVYIMKEDLRELPEDSYYIMDLISCEVFDTNSNAVIGTIKDVLQYSAQDIIEVKKVDGDTFMMPLVKEFVKDVDIVNKKVTVSLIPGFIDGAIEV